MRKHARASAVQVCLKHTSPRTLMISIADNGQGLADGFDLSALSAEGHYGLLGISETSSDFREVLEEAEAGSAQHQLAIDLFCQRVKKYIGAYAAEMGG